jgi:hypothetical protein
VKEWEMGLAAGPDGGIFPTPWPASAPNPFRVVLLQQVNDHFQNTRLFCKRVCVLCTSWGLWMHQLDNAKTAQDHEQGLSSTLLVYSTWW